MAKAVHYPDSSVWDLHKVLGLPLVVRRGNPFAKYCVNENHKRKPELTYGGASNLPDIMSKNLEAGKGRTRYGDLQWRVRRIRCHLHAGHCLHKSVIAIVLSSYGKTDMMYRHTGVCKLLGKGGLSDAQE